VSERARGGVTKSSLKANDEVTKPSLKANDEVESCVWYK
jgi:hypothetical protein